MLEQTQLASIARLGSSHEAMHSIRQQDCSLSIWQRQPVSAYGALVAGDPQDIRFTTGLDDLVGSFQTHLDCEGFSRPELHSTIADDVLLLATEFCSIMKLTSVDIRLEIVTTDSCRKWHADYVTARLITTYVGSGTQWLEEPDAARVRNGLAPRAINQLGTGDVGIFKGKLGFGNPVAHRSPPIGESGERRLLLVINPSQRI